MNFLTKVSLFYLICSMGQLGLAGPLESIELSKAIIQSKISETSELREYFNNPKILDLEKFNVLSEITGDSSEDLMSSKINLSEVVFELDQHIVSLRQALDVPPTTADLTGIVEFLNRDRIESLDRKLELERLDALTHYVQVALLQNLFHFQTRKRYAASDEAQKIHRYLAPSLQETLARAKSILAYDLEPDWMATLDKLELLNSAAKAGNNLEFKAGFSVETLVRYLQTLEVTHVDFLASLEKAKKNKKKPIPGIKAFYEKVVKDPSYSRFDELVQIVAIFMKAEHYVTNLFIICHPFAKQHYAKINAHKDDFETLKRNRSKKAAPKNKRTASKGAAPVNSLPLIPPNERAPELEPVNPEPPRLAVEKEAAQIPLEEVVEPSDDSLEEEVLMTEEQAVRALKDLFFKYAQEKDKKSEPKEVKAERPQWLQKIAEKFSREKYKAPLLRFFDDSQIHETFKFQEIQALVKRAGGKIIFNKSSHCQIVMPNRGFGHSWRSHGNDKERPLTSQAVKRFRDAFISAGITPETLGLSEN